MEIAFYSVLIFLVLLQILLLAPVFTRVVNLFSKRTGMRISTGGIGLFLPLGLIYCRHFKMEFKDPGSKDNLYYQCDHILMFFNYFALLIGKIHFYFVSLSTVKARIENYSHGEYRQKQQEKIWQLLSFIVIHNLKLQQGHFEILDKTITPSILTIVDQLYINKGYFNGKVPVSVILYGGDIHGILRYKGNQSHQSVFSLKRKKSNNKILNHLTISRLSIIYFVPYLSWLHIMVKEDIQFTISLKYTYQRKMDDIVIHSEIELDQEKKYPYSYDVPLNMDDFKLPFEEGFNLLIQRIVIRALTMIIPGVSKRSVQWVSENLTHKISRGLKGWKGKLFQSKINNIEEETKPYENNQ